MRRWLLLLLLCPAAFAQTHVFVPLDGNNDFTGTNTFTGTTVITGTLVSQGTPGQIVDISTANDASTGTTAFYLAKRTSTNTAVIATTADTAIPLYPVAAAVTAPNGTTYAQAGTTGNAPLVLIGKAQCQFDAGGASDKDFVGESTTANGKCKSLGASYPAGACWVGQAIGNIASGTVGPITVLPACSLAPSGYSTIQDSTGASSTQYTKLKFLAPFGVTANVGNTSTDISIPDGTSTTPGICFSSDCTFGFYNMGSQKMGFTTPTYKPTVILAAGSFNYGANVVWQWSSTNAAGTADTGLSRVSAGVVAIGNASSGDTSGGIQLTSILQKPVHFAALGTPANGTLYYCDDCQIANPCAGTGTGALAKRLNGAWVCN